MFFFDIFDIFCRLKNSLKIKEVLKNSGYYVLYNK